MTLKPIDEDGMRTGPEPRKPAAVKVGKTTIRLRTVLLGIVAAFVLLALMTTAWVGIKTVRRSQARADAHNQAVVAQRLVEKVRAEADQRREEAKGIRDAQDTIKLTLSPLYVQHEAVEAQLAMAKSQNHTIIYVPAGTNGTPVITESGRAGATEEGGG